MKSFRSADYPDCEDPRRSALQEFLRIHDGAIDISEEFEFVGAANVVAVARRAVGNDAFGNASEIGPRPRSIALLPTSLKPSNRRISFCSSAIISAFFIASMTMVYGTKINKNQFN